MTPTTVGVDLASQPAKTAVAVIRWQEPLEVVLRLGADDDEVVGLSTGTDRVGIDAPLGWPIPFVGFVAAHERGLAPDIPALVDLRFRSTDQFVRDETGRWPLSVSTDLIGVTAIRCARLQAAFESAGVQVDRSGVAGRIAEVYPAAALHRWGFRSRGYKADRSVRSDLVDEVLAHLPPVTADREALVASDDVFDAFVCALIARAVDAGQTMGPPTEITHNAEMEGWIHLPAATDLRSSLAL